MTKALPSSFTIALIVSLGGFVFGFDASVISGVNSYVSLEFDINEWQLGFLVGVPTLGAAIASLVAGTVSDRIGRRKVLLSIAGLYVVSALLSALASSYWVLVAARTLGGFAFASLVLAPVYIAEISTASHRGKMISINQFNIVIGISAAYFANYYLLNLAQQGGEWATALGITDNVWRWMLGIEVIPAALFLLLLTRIPESPRFLALNNQKEQARQVLIQLHGERAMLHEMAEIEEKSHHKKARLLDSFKELFSSKMRKVLSIGIIIAVVQQITGVNAIYFYAPTIFEQSGVGTNAAFAQAIWVGIINVLFTVVAMLLIDKVGRKPLLIVGLTGIFISMSLVSYGFKNATYQLTAEQVTQLPIEASKLDHVVGVNYADDLAFKDAIKESLSPREFKVNEAKLIQSAINIQPELVLFGILGFVASFAVSLGPVMWVLLAEIFPNHMRGIAIAVTGLINSAVSFTVQLMFPWEINYLGTAMTFLLCGIFAVIGLFLVMYLLPETKSKSLEQIELELIPGRVA
ncbi:sugar porter family MFS transporter [Thalassotalea mangrovi]|uniref:Sugar porter family MFS transporter n=1 Tax=Thalassotalea mangrovi TaxID=2572245 RepID=A0A4U1BAF4_9GAMM|nr:sugar porter family MFS transporter [Thalassotalea mangrovi]TKB47666.1 sugar porter family MFS transporter [Thalassotalea mangrovi]